MDPNKKKMLIPIIVAVLVVLYYLAYFSVLIFLVDGIWKFILGAVPFILAVAVIKLCMEKISG